MRLDLLTMVVSRRSAQMLAEWSVSDLHLHLTDNFVVEALGIIAVLDFLGMDTYRYADTLAGLTTGV